MGVAGGIGEWYQAREQAAQFFRFYRDFLSAPSFPLGSASKISNFLALAPSTSSSYGKYTEWMFPEVLERERPAANESRPGSDGRTPPSPMP